MLGPTRSAGTPRGWWADYCFQGRLAVAGQQQRGVRTTPSIAGTFGWLAAAVLGYGAVTVIGQGHGALGTRWRAAVLIGGGTSIGLLALIAAVLAVARWCSRASRALFPVAMGLMGAGADRLGGSSRGR